MKKSRFSESQIVSILKESEDDTNRILTNGLFHANYDVKMTVIKSWMLLKL